MATAKRDLDYTYLGQAWLLLSGQKLGHTPAAMSACTQAPPTPPAWSQSLSLVWGPPADPAPLEDQATYVRKGMGCTSFRSGSFSLTVSACLFFRSPRASSMMACVSAALTDTSWIDMSLTAQRVGQGEITKLQTRAKAETVQAGMQLIPFNLY